MALSIQLSHDFATCKIVATISDSLNRGQNGVVTITVSGSKTLTAPFTKLTNTPRTISFDAPKTGLIHTFDGKVKSGADTAKDTIVSQTCPPPPPVEPVG